MTSRKFKQAKPPKIDRREFLKLMASSTIASLIPPGLKVLQLTTAEWPVLGIGQLPVSIGEILRLVPDTIVRPDGHLALASKDTGAFENVRLEPTKWNQENSNPWNQLDTNVSWGIVLHWFGDRYPEQGDTDFYLRGFNGMRQIGEFYTSTSAHFLVGDNPPIAGAEQDSPGILQTQKPGPAGVPYEAAHMRDLDYTAYREGRHYFISGLNELSRRNPQFRSILQDYFDQPWVYPHMRTLSIEITGYDFDNPEKYPRDQKIANVVSVVWAIMKRYGIAANNITGHLEIQLSKSDPGKKFLALIKYLVGVKALIEQDEAMRMLVFGQFLDEGGDSRHAVLAYFEYLRDYLMLTATPRQVSEWEAWSKYFILYETIQHGCPQLSGVETHYPPVVEPSWQPGYHFIIPDNHEGIDIYPDLRAIPNLDPRQDVQLMASGICIYLGRSTGLHDGQLAIFRHRQVDGSEVISSYGHLNGLANLKIGEKYTGGQVIGQITTPKTPPHGFLHFSLAYGPSWDIYLNKSANIPLNVGPTWIRNFFINPSKYLANKSLVPGDVLKNSHHIPI
jgi:hypothetical protein